MPKFVVEEVSPIERSIKVEVEPERVVAQVESAYRKLSRQVRVPGFRPGKVPRRILEARYKQQVEGEVIQGLVEESWREALLAHPEVLAVAPPRVNAGALEADKPFSYQAHVEVKPKVDPKDYEGLEIQKAKVDVGEPQVEAELSRLRESMSKTEPVVGRTVAQAGDLATVHYEGVIEGKPFAGGKGEDVTFEVVPGDFGQGKLGALAGAAIGETRDVTHTFGADHRLAELAGKTATFKVTLDGLKTRTLPALDDTFAKEIGGGLTVAELKARVLTELTESATEKAEHDHRNGLVQALIQKNPFELPRSMVEHMVDMMLERAVAPLIRQGLDLRRMNLDFDRLRADARPRAETEVRGALLLEAIADKEKIVTTPADLDARIKKLAAQMAVPEEKVRAQLQKQDGFDGLSRQVREEKTLAFLESKSKIAVP